MTGESPTRRRPTPTRTFRLAWETSATEEYVSEPAARMRFSSFAEPAREYWERGSGGGRAWSPRRARERVRSDYARRGRDDGELGAGEW